MKNESRIKFEAYKTQIAQINGVSGTENFAIDPSIEQKLETRIQESADFLKSINILPVDELTGEKIGIGTSGPIASRTDTDNKERQTRDIHNLTKDQYLLKETEFDTHVKYKTVDTWAKFPDFQNRMRDNVIKQIARDRLTIGFNGTSHAVETDLNANPLLQDVNIGWLHHIKTSAPERVLSGIKVGIGPAGQDYKNIDAAVFDAIAELLDTWHKNRNDIVVICGSQLLDAKYLSLIDSNEAPTERNALQTLLSNKQIGNKKTEIVPFFPEKSILITPKDNLSIYYQEGSRRRTIVDNPKRNRVEDYQSVNEGYVVEDFGACCLLDGIQTPNATNDGWE